MSCFVVGKRHIDALVTCAQRLAEDRQYLRFAGFDPVTRPDEFGQILWDANVEAYNDRYDENMEKQEYHFEKFNRKLEPIEIIKACDCLDYQCSDWYFWGESTAKILLDTIRKLTIQSLPGYDEAQWEVYD